MAGFFGLNDYNRPGPGVRKGEPEKKGLARYFDILGKRFWKIVTLNFLYFVFSIIPFILMWAVCAVSMVWTVSLKMSADELSEWLNQGGTLMILILSLIIYSNCGGGASACGMINVLRKYVSDTHAWVWQDFIDAFKRNFFKGTVSYIIDLLAAGILIMNYGFYNIQSSGLINVILRALLMLVIFIWGMMHVYIYPCITSFNFKLRDVYKNSFIMVLGKLPQTAGAFIIGLFISFTVIYFSVAVIYFALLIPILLFAFCEYTRLSISYPLIVKYMADSVPEPKAPVSDEETVFSDERTDSGDSGK